MSNRILFCDCCEMWTPHALNWSKTAYVCGCGSEIEYHVNKAKPMMAMDLRETPDAQKRFNEWTQEQQ